MILHRRAVGDSDSYQEYLKTPCLGSKLDISVFHNKIQPHCESINKKMQASFTNFIQFLVLQVVVIQLDK